MKSGKATGPDIAFELLKAKSWDPTLWLSEFFNRVIQEGRTASDWQENTTVPMWKKKSNPAECSNYLPIWLVSYTMKIFERVLDNRIREIVEITVNQAGFVNNCGTTDAIHAARFLMEKHRPLYIAFLDLEKAFDRVPHELILYALRQRLPLAYDNTCQKNSCDRYGVAPIVEKLRERPLRWYDHTIRANENSLAKIGLNIKVDGKRPKGRPKQRWLDTLDGDLKASRLHPD